MKIKITAIVLAVLALVGIYFILDTLEVINKPSPEMMQLRQAEKELALPTDDVRRSESNKGCYTDGKGAPHCKRSIFFYYKSNQYWPELQAQLKEQGWKTYDAGDGYYRAWNNQSASPVCITRSPASSESGSHVWLSSQTDDQCRFIIKQSSQTSS